MIKVFWNNKNQNIKFKSKIKFGKYEFIIISSKIKNSDL